MPTIGEILNSKYSTAFKDQTLSGNNTTVATPLFTITGTVQLTMIYGVITTALGSNVTAAYWRLNDQTAQVDITLASGTTISSYAVGSNIKKGSSAASALNANNSSAGRVSDASTTNFAPTVLIQKTGGVLTQIEFVYSTTNTPTSGVIRHIVEWQPLSTGATLVAV